MIIYLLSTIKFYIMNKINIGIFSDTHGLHYDWESNHLTGEVLEQWNKCDILIFAGDCSSRGLFREIKHFLDWFSKQPAKYKVMIAGNHDFGFEYIDKKNENYPIEIPDNITYLDDNSVEILGLNIHGSPIQPEFYNWAFNRKRGEDIKKHWDMIPNNTDILVTHGPPKGILDSVYYENVGCQDLLESINRIQPTLSIFGHIHEGYGNIKIGNTEYFNASSLDSNYRPINPPLFKTIA